MHPQRTCTSWPLRSVEMSSAQTSPSSSAVTMTGPMGLKVSNVLPTSHWPPLRSSCQSRALKAQGEVWQAVRERGQGTASLAGGCGIPNVMGNSVASNILGRVGGRHILGSAANHNGKLHLGAAAAAEAAVAVGERRWHWTVAMCKHATPVYYSCGGALCAVPQSRAWK